MRVCVYCDERHPREDLGDIDLAAKEHGTLVRHSGIGVVCFDYGFGFGHEEKTGVWWDVYCPRVECGGRRRSISASNATMTKALEWAKAHVVNPGEISLVSLRILAHNSGNLPDS